jgi:hypothetical protein
VTFSLPVRAVNQKIVVSAVFVAAMFMNNYGLLGI